MRTETVEEKVKRLITEQLQLEESEVVDDAVLSDDLSADSLDRVELVMDLENEFDIPISDEEAEAVRTVGDTVKLVEGKVKP